MAAQRAMTFGIVVGNRGFFPGHLAKTGRDEILAVLREEGAKAIVLGPEESRHGAVETYEEAERCAALFKKHAEEIDGIILTLPNFGEERGIVDAIRLSGLKVPVLVQATPDRSRRHDDRGAARQLLREDERVQQHDAVRNQVLADHAAYRSGDVARVQGGPGVVLGGLPHCERAEEPAHRGDRRAAHGVQHGALLGADPRDQRHHGGDAGSVGGLRTHRPAEGHRRCGRRRS